MAKYPQKVPNSRPIKVSADKKAASEFSLDTLLGQIGGLVLGDLEIIESEITTYCAKTGLEMAFASFRHKELTLSCSPGAKGLITFDLDMIKESINTRSPGCISVIRLNTKRSF